MSTTLADQLQIKSITPSKLILLSAQGKRIHHKGTTTLRLQLDDLPAKEYSFLVTNNLRENLIIGADILQDLKATLFFPKDVPPTITNLTHSTDDPTIEDILSRPDVKDLIQQIYANAWVKHNPPSEIRPVHLELIKPLPEKNVTVFLKDHLTTYGQK